MSTVTTINGAPVGIGTAAAFQALSSDFKAATGYDLQVNGPLGGIRTYAQQLALYQAYLKGGTLAANPDDPSVAHHMSGHALDISDTGTDAGVDTIGSARHTALLGLLAKHGFTNEGDTFTPQEAWHYYYTGDPYTAPPQTEEDDMPYTPQELSTLIQQAVKVYCASQDFHDRVKQAVQDSAVKLGTPAVNSVATAVQNAQK